MRGRRSSNWELQPDPGLETRTTKGHSQRVTEAILKDLHLIQTALITDRIVVALDENARLLFKAPELNTITWFNPVSERDRIVPWLEEGAPPVEEWRLGHGF